MFASLFSLIACAVLCVLGKQQLSLKLNMAGWISSMCADLLYVIMIATSICGEGCTITGGFATFMLATANVLCIVAGCCVWKQTAYGNSI
jgi:hypothetical protein